MCLYHSCVHQGCGSVGVCLLLLTLALMVTSLCGKHLSVTSSTMPRRPSLCHPHTHNIHHRQRQHQHKHKSASTTTRAIPGLEACELLGVVLQRQLAHLPAANTPPIHTHMLASIRLTPRQHTRSLSLPLASMGVTSSPLSPLPPATVSPTSQPPRPSLSSSPLVVGVLDAHDGLEQHTGLGR